MKKGLIVMFGLIVAVFLSGCDNRGGDVWKNGIVLDDMYGQTSFTVEELDLLEESFFPASYTYKTYKKGEWVVIDSGEYVYAPNEKYLLPIGKYIVDKEISSSEINSGLVYSVVDATIEGSGMVSILYINSPETLKYSSATMYMGDEVTIYRFNY